MRGITISHRMKGRAPGKLILRNAPRVVGTLFHLDSLYRLPLLHEKSCDIAEIRLDQIGYERDWQEGARSIEGSGMPTILTLRGVAEGGKWSGPEKGRLSILTEAMPVVSAIDVELQSGLAPVLLPMLKRRSKYLIVSYHDFKETPAFEKLSAIIAKASKQASIIKISTMIRSQADIQVHLKLLSKSWPVPICLIGMGALGTATRVAFPCLGSVLTYGYLDTPSAPGQLPARTLVETLRAIHPKYRQLFVVHHRVRKAV